MSFRVQDLVVVVSRKPEQQRERQDMMTVADKAKYQQHRDTGTAVYSLWLPMLLFGSMGAIIGGGFGIGFPLAALWCLGYSCAPCYIDWWKMWELNAGFNLGLLYVAALYWATGRVDKAHHPNGDPIAGDTEAVLPPNLLERRRGISLVLAICLLLVIMFFGASSNVGVLLGLYMEGGVDQYAWPHARVALFAPAAVLILGAAAYKTGRIVWLSRTRTWRGFEVPRLAERMADLMTVIGAVGAATIWPSKIGVLYALFLCLALFAFHRLNRHFDDTDQGAGTRRD